MDISKIDKNFVVKSNIEKEDIEFFNAEDKPFKIYGVFKENEKFRRMPENVASKVSEGVYSLHARTAGGRVRFVTDSSYVAIVAKMGVLGKMPHFALTGSLGFDMYADNIYMKTFVPPYDIVDGYESVQELGENQEREITINFPLYSEVEELYIGIQKGSILKEAKDYKNDKPIVYYGSSITQGGCASRPGMAYQSIITRRFDYDHINLGFSGCAKGEDEIINYIKNLDMSIFVSDYDHNAPTVEHLKNTHEKLYKAVREKHPNLPIIIMSRPKFVLSDEEKMRLEVVKNTYNNAVSNGDKNVYLLTGKELSALCEKDGMVDGCHPTDLGFFSMAKAVGDVIEKIIN